MGLESPQHECGVIGIFSPGKEVSQEIFYGLIALQNRGQEGSGIATVDENGKIYLRKDEGLVYAVYSKDDIASLKGSIGVGHNRYGITGKSSKENAHPFLVDSDIGPFAFVHNGNIHNTLELRKELAENGVKFDSSTDSEVVAQLIAKSSAKTMVGKIKEAAPKIKGAYSCLIANKDSLIGFKDPRGVWPLSIGRFNGNGYIVASETNGIEKAGGSNCEDINAGEIVVIDREGARYDSLGREQESLCSFEYYYFCDPYSKLLGRRVENARFDMGVALAEEHSFDADWIIPVPETARPAAEGYAFASKIPVRSALIRNRWLGRTFIEPSQRLRELAAELKYGSLPEIIEGKKIIVIDDTIVRGTTTKKLVKLVRNAGAKEVSVLSTAPPIRGVCWDGVDTADLSELIAANKSIEEIRAFIGADHLGYLSLEAGIKAIGLNLKDRLCISCFTGQYRMQIPNGRDKFILEGEKVHA
ncbi:MAG: amidophosphoribosyltransferase [Microgenomates group bacterium]|jgi:amidophosphoribosyltransferase